MRRHEWKGEAREARERPRGGERGLPRLSGLHDRWRLQLTWYPGDARWETGSQRRRRRHHENQRGRFEAAFSAVAMCGIDPTTMHARVLYTQPHRGPVWVIEPMLIAGVAELPEG